VSLDEPVFLEGKPADAPFKPATVITSVFPLIGKKDYCFFPYFTYFWTRNQADMEWEKQLKIQAERAHKKIGEMKNATSCLDGFKRCKLHCFRHYHYMTCTDFLIEVGTTIFFFLDTPLDIYYVFRAQFFDRWFFYLQCIFTFIPFLAMLGVAIFGIKKKIMTTQSCCSLYWLAMFSQG
jgi:hypothetical protein